MAQSSEDTVFGKITQWEPNKLSSTAYRARMFWARRIYSPAWVHYIKETCWKDCQCVCVCPPESDCLCHFDPSAVFDWWWFSFYINTTGAQSSLLLLSGKFGTSWVKWQWWRERQYKSGYDTDQWRGGNQVGTTTTTKKTEHQTQQFHTCK